MQDAIKALTFDTGGTILDWHTGIAEAFATAGTAHGLDKDWGTIANDYRRRSLKKMLNAGGETPASFNIDDAHWEMLQEIAADQGLEAFIRRPNEWGLAGPPDPEPNPECDIIADDFPGLARQLGLA